MTVPQLPGFRYVKPLGRGGYGEVFSAYQDRFDRWVAVKVLSFTLTDERLQRQFVRECRLAGRLSAHPNIVTVYDSGIVPGGRPYITMELFADGSIADALRLQGQLPVADALRTGIALAGALETAHGAGVVHRDVKPANVLLATYGQPALTDFGLSVVTERPEVSTGIDALTPYHAAPEVLERTAATPGSDVYSLASTVYAMLAGRAPHQGSDDSSPDSIAALLLRVLQRDVPPLDRPDAPPSLRAALDRALARDPAARTPTAAAFAAELQAVQRELGLEVTEPVVMAVPGAAEAPAPPEPGAGLVLPPPPPAPPLPAPPAPPPSPPSPPSPDAGTGGSDRPPLPSRTPNRTAPAEAAAEGDGNGNRNGRGSTTAAEPSLDQLAALERALLGQPQPTTPLDPPPERPRRPPPAPLRRRPDVPAPPRAAPPEAPLLPPTPPAPLAPPTPPPPLPPPAPPLEAPAPQVPEAAPAPEAPPEEPAEAPLPAWVTDAVGAPPVAQDRAASEPPDGDTTIERAAVRGYLPPTGPPPAAPVPRRRAGLLPAAAVLLVVAAVAAAFVLIPKDDSGSGTGDGTGERVTPPTTLAPPTGLTAVESAAGVQLDWDGEESEIYAVLMMSEIASPQVLPAESGTSMLIPATRMVPEDGYCFAVSYLSDLEAASQSTEDAFGPPACIRGASEDTVRPG